MIAVLLIVLIGPFFVDWTEYKETFEDYAEQALGHPVTVLGDVDVQLIPVPNLSFSDVRVGESENPLITVSSITVVAELPPLLKRELKVRELILEQPTLGVGVDEEGQLDWLIVPGGQTDIGFSSVEVDDIRINNGKVIISDARTGNLHTLDEVNLLGDAQSMLGPFRAQGSVKYAGRKFGISTATSRWQQDEGVLMNTKISTESESVSVDFTGTLSVNEKKPVYEGGFNISSRVPEDLLEGSIPQIWNGVGKFSIDISGIRVDEANIRFGPEDRAISMQADMISKFGQDRKFEVNLAAKQINLDRLIGQGPEEPVATPVAAEKVLEFLQNLPSVEGAGTVQASFPSVVVNGSIIQEMQISAEPEPSGWNIKELTAQLPGRTRINSSGILSFYEHVSFNGSLELESEQPSTLLSWWQGSKSSENLWLEPLKFTMNLDVGNVRQEFFGIEGMIGEEQFNGSLRMEQNRDSSKQEVSVNFDVDLLRLEQIQGISNLLHLTDSRSDSVETDSILSSNIRLKLSAKEIDLGEVTVSSVDVTLNFNEGKLELTSFEASDFAGASVDASGTIANFLVNPIGSIDLRLDAFDLEKPVLVLGEYFPENVVVGHLTSQPDLYSPMRLKIKLAVEPFAGESKSILSVSGKLADSTVNSNISFIGSPFDYSENSLVGTFAVESEAGIKLLRQIGITPGISGELGKTTLTVKMNGESIQNVNVDLSLASDTIELLANGGVENFGSSSLGYNLKLDLKSADLSDLKTLTGKNFPTLHGNLPIDLTARIIGEGSKFGLSRISGQYAGVNFSGKLSRSVVRDRQIVRGELDVTELKFLSLSELILGQGVWAETGFQSVGSVSTNSDGESFWPTIGFKPPTIEDGRFEFKINTKKLRLSQDFELPDASFQLSLTPDTLVLDDFKSEVSDGNIFGNMIIRQSAGEARMTGSVEFEDIELVDLFQRPGVTPTAKGRLNLKADIETTGQTIARLVSGLTGVGTFLLESGEFSNLNAGAFERVIADADRGMLIELDSVNDRFSKYLAAGSFKFDESDGHLSISAGQIKLSNVDFESEEAEISLDSEFDIDEWQFENNLSIKSNIIDETGGAVPRVDLSFTGSIGNLERVVDTSRFVSFLAIRQFEKESRERDLRDAEDRRREEEIQKLKQLQPAEETKQEEETEQDADVFLRSNSTTEDAPEGSATEQFTPDPQALEPELEESQKSDTDEGPKTGSDSNLSNGDSASESNNDTEKSDIIRDLIDQNTQIGTRQQDASKEAIQNVNNRVDESDQKKQSQQRKLESLNSNSSEGESFRDQIQKTLDAAADKQKDYVDESVNKGVDRESDEIIQKELEPLIDEN